MVPRMGSPGGRQLTGHQALTWLCAAGLLWVLATVMLTAVQAHRQLQPEVSGVGRRQWRKERAEQKDRAYWNTARGKQRVEEAEAQREAGHAAPHLGRGEGPIPRRNYTRVHLVVPRFREDLAWLVSGWGQKHSHTIYDKAADIPDFSTRFTELAPPYDGSRYFLTNFGDEAAAYLRFIIDHYDDLPEVTVFLHGKPLEHNPQLAGWLGCLKPHTWFTYLTRSFVDDRCIVDLNNQSLVPKFDSGAFADFWVQFPWAELGLGAMPRCLSFYCCAEFAISRKAIQSKPLSFYKKIWSFTLKFIIDENVSRKYKGWALKQIGGFYEHVWHVMFGEQMMMHRYNPCDYFLPQCGPCKEQYLLEANPLPPNHAHSGRGLKGIRVLSAFYGANCAGADPLTAKETSAILHQVKRRCDDRPSCDYRVNITESARQRPTGGAPCSRELFVEWRCPGDSVAHPTRSLRVPGEAHARLARLECPEAAATPAPFASACVAAASGSDVPAVLCAESARLCRFSLPSARPCADACAAMQLSCTTEGIPVDDSNVDTFPSREGCGGRRYAHHDIPCGESASMCVCSKRLHPHMP